MPIVAGVDEAGRGCLAGPVVAAAVILKTPINGLADSKTLTAKKREALYKEIMHSGADIGLAMLGPRRIDELNIFQATMHAMTRAISRLHAQPQHILIDGKHIPKTLDQSQFEHVEAIVKGDQKIPEISAASIIAKVSRDRLMRKLATRHPKYQLDKHKGYATKAHYKAIDSFGILPCHRLSFKLIQETLINE